MTGYRLGVDFGTSTTIAMLRRPDGRVQPLLFDGSPMLSSAVLLGPDGRLHTGRDAAHLARSAPERLEPNPKRRIDDTSVLLGDAEVGVRDLVMAVLGRVATEASRVAGPVSAITLTHPANWGSGRRAVLLDAARSLGFGSIELVSEPMAAATYFAHTRGADLPVGACVVVYDLGAGTCDVTVLRRAPHGFEPIASDGLNDVGGLDVDATVVAFLEATYGTLWTDAATRRQVWEDVRSAKEMLSRASGTVVMLPALGKEVPLGREQLEGLARPVLRQTVAMTRALLGEAGVPVASIAGLFLVGGSSRIPLVATLLHEAIGIAPIVAEQPELVVAEGSLHVGAAPTPGQGTAPQTGVYRTQSVPVSAMPASGVPVSGMPSSGMPVTGMPVTGMPSSGVPVSAHPYPGAPVSVPPRPYQGPPPSGGMPAGAPAWGAPSAPQAKRRAVALPVLLTLVIVLILAGAGAGAYVYIGNHNAGTGSGTASGGGNSGGGGGGGAQGSTGGAGGSGKAKYNYAKVPENICGTFDVSALNAQYEGKYGEPEANYNQTESTGTTVCTVIRTHTAGGNITTVSAMITIMAAKDTATPGYAYNALTKAAQPRGGRTTTAVPGLGDEAAVFQSAFTKSSGSSSITVGVVVRDSNVYVTLYLSLNRPDDKGFTDAQEQDAETKAAAIMKATYSKTMAGMVAA